MTHVVTLNCAGCKFTDCVVICPVDCFYEIDEMLVIDPSECIDCGACVSMCCVEAIYSDDELPKNQEWLLSFNAEEADNVRSKYGTTPLTKQKSPLPSAAAQKAQLGY